MMANACGKAPKFINVFFNLCRYFIFFPPPILDTLDVPLLTIVVSVVRYLFMAAFEN